MAKDNGDSTVGSPGNRKIPSKGGSAYSRERAYERAKRYDEANPSGFKKGGVVKKTGMAKVHKGERIVPKKK